MDMKSLFRNIGLTVLAALCTVLVTSCKDDETSDALELYYSTVVDIGPSMNFVSGVPTYHGPTPGNFAIAGITLDDRTVTSDCFSISPDTGMVSISNTADLEPGTYKLTITCQAGGGSYTFRDIFVVEMVPSTPAEIELSASSIDIPYAELETTEAQVTVKPVGESVKIRSYSLVQREGFEYFAISNEGVITLDPNFEGEILPGNYPLSVKIDTYAGSKTFEGLLTAHITSLPLSVEYAPSAGRMETDRSFTSATPTLKGSPDEVVWAIKEVRPGAESAQTDLIRIDPATGVISVAEGNGLAVGSTYTLDLTVTNRFGSADFESAYTLTVIAYIAPIEAETFAYAPVEVVEGTSFKAPKNEGFVGDEVTFTLGELPAALAGQLQIDPATGEISALSKLMVEPGEYQIPVQASNIKSETPVETTFTLKVIANPNMFTTFSYGNNLDLDWTTNADQWLFDMEGGTKDDTVVEIPLTHQDFNGREVTFKMSWVHNNPIRTASTKTYITDDGTVHMTLRNDRAGQFGVVKIDATIGSGETAVTRSTYLFVKTQTAVDKAVVYKPMVIRINPRTGGYSDAPIIDGDKSKFMMTLKRNIFYYNFNGPSSHKSGQLSTSDTNTFIYRMWATYPWSNGAVNPSSREPMSYYDLNSSSVATDLTGKFGYIDCGNDSKMYIPAGKWMMDGAYANGVLIFQAPYTLTGNFATLDASGTTTFIYEAVWFDENF